MSNKTRLIVICGLSGSGKTTYAKRLVQELHAVRYCPDEWMESLGVSLWDGAFRSKLEAQLWQQAQELLRLGQSVIVEYGCWARQERDEKLQGARALGVRVELVYMDTPLDVQRARLASRNQEGDEILVHKVEENATLFQVPTQEEGNLYDSFSIIRPADT